MELRSLQSPAISGVVRRDLTEKLFIRGRAVGLSNFKRYRDVGAGKISLIGAFRAQASSGTTKFRSEAVESIPKDANSKDENLVFVAGATGKVGSRTVRELLKLGFRVRAGVRSVQRAESLLQSVKQMKLDEATSEGSQPIEKLEIVECDLEKQDQIVPALGNSAIVICCIGASEKEIFDVTGPYRIDYQATKNLVDAATAVKVNHFILLTSLGTNKIGFPAAILNLFWGVLIWKRKAEEALFASGLPYTIVRPGGMERPTDSYKETHNITLSKEDTLFGGQVSNLQVAELMAFMAKNCSLSYCKVVEVIAETTAPLTPLGELLATIPSNRPEPKVYPSKELGASDVLPTPEASEAATTSIEEKPTESTSTKTRPLSPYTAYDDLKPPSSPTPNPPSGGKADVLKTLEMKVSISDLKLETVEVPASRPLSPYSAYEDLKPPTSPMPTPSGPRETPPTSHIIEGNDVAAKTQPFTSGHSPFLVYDNLKPPTSPSPGNGTTPSAEQSGEKEACVESKPRPLSPFAMYEDLKPPTSPTPTKP